MRFLVGALALAALASFGCSRAGLFAGSPPGEGPDKVPVELPCLLVSAGAPKTLVSFPEGNTDAPMMVTVNQGSSEAPARIAYQAISEDANFWHPELRVGALRAGPSWPNDVSFDHEPSLYGFDAHAWGAITASPVAAEEIGLAWYHADEAAGVPIGLKFRSINTTSWSSSQEVFVDPGGTVVYSFSRGPGVDTAGDFGGLGYAIAYRFDAGGSYEPRVVIIDVQGNVVYGPVATAPPEEYPGRGAGVVWTGARYLVATGFDACSTPDFCAPRSITLSTLAPANKGSGVEVLWSIEASQSTFAPRRPVLAARGDRVFVLWAEGLAEDDDGLRTVRLARLDGSGALLGEVETLAEGALILSPLQLNASPLGVVASWVEQGGDDGPPDQPGFTRVVVHHRDMAGAALGDPIVIQATEAANHPGPALAVTEVPKALWVSWAGIESEAGPDKTFLARFDCSEGP